MDRPGKLLIGGALAALCLIWGTTWAVIQIGLEGIPPASGVAIRFAIASALLFILAHSMKVRLGTTSREKWLWLVNGSLAFCVSYGIIYWSEQWVPSGLTAVLFATHPLFVALFAHKVLPSERLRSIEVAGIVLGFVGVGLIFSEDLHTLGGARVSTAAIIMLLSPLAAAIATVAVKRWGAGIHPFSLSVVPMAMTAGVMGALAFAFERGRNFEWDSTSIGALLYLAVFGSVITFTLYFWLLSHLSAKRLSLIAYVIPIVAVVIGAIRGEPMTLRTLAGAALVVAGTALAVHHFSPQKSPGKADERSVHRPAATID
jgi:drug/metabolite transporter (DMT)-like permease